MGSVAGSSDARVRLPKTHKSFTPDAIKNITIPDTRLNSDIHAGAEYRAHLVGVMARRRAVAGCG